MGSQQAGRGVTAWLCTPADGKDDLIRTMLSMLRDLHNNYGWDELDATLEEVEDLAEDLGITDEE